MTFEDKKKPPSKLSQGVKEAPVHLVALSLIHIFTMWALYICIFIVIYGRMIEIYLVTSVAPVPMAAMMGKAWGGMGQNYLCLLYTSTIYINGSEKETLLSNGVDDQTGETIESARQCPGE